MNLYQRILLEAKKRGYRVTPGGEVISPFGRVLSTWPNKKGYLSFSIASRVSGKRANLLVHRLAALQMFGEAMLDTCMEVRHLDGNPTNNRLSNLALGTPSQNSFDRPPEKRRLHSLRAARKLRKLSFEEASRLREDRRKGHTYKELCLKYGISKSTVSYIVNGKTYVAQ